MASRLRFRGIRLPLLLSSALVTTATGVVAAGTVSCSSSSPAGFDAGQADVPPETYPRSVLDSPGAESVQDSGNGSRVDADMSSSNDAGASSTVDAGMSSSNDAGASPQPSAPMGDKQFCSADGVCWLNPLPQLIEANPYAKMWGTDSDLWVPGSFGSMMHWNGHQWSSLATGGGRPFSGVFGFGPRNIWAVGYAGALARFDGQYWSEVTNPTTSKETLFGIWGSSPTDIWAVGNNGEILHGNGSTWESHKQKTDKAFFAIWGSGPTDIYAIGQDGICAHFDGTDWTLATLSSAWLTAVTGTSASDVWAAGRTGTLLHYDGEVWQSQHGPTTDNITSIVALSRDEVWMTTDKGTLFHYKNQEWNPLQTDQRLESIASATFVDESHFWLLGRAKGETGSLFAAFRWDIASTDVPRNTLIGLCDNAFTSVWGTSDDDVWIAGESCPLFHWNGSSWTQTGEAGMRDGVLAIGGSGPGDVWVAGTSNRLSHYNDLTGWRRVGSAFADTLSYLDVLDVATSAQGQAWFVVGERNSSGASLYSWGGGLNPVRASCDEGPCVTPVDPPRKIWSFGGSVWILGKAGSLYKWNGAPSSYWDLNRGDTGFGGPALASSDDGVIGGTSDSDIWIVRAVGDSEGDGSRARATGPVVHPVRHWTGSKMEEVAIPSYQIPRAIAVRRDDVWLVGDRGMMLHWNGHAWTSRQQVTGGTLRAVWSSPAGKVWAVGDSGVVLTDAPEGRQASAPAVSDEIVSRHGWRWSEKRSTWTEQRRTSSIASIWGTDPNILWAIDGTRILHTRGSLGWNQHIWAVQYTGSNRLTALWGSSESDVYAVGENGTLVHYDGQSWSDWSAMLVPFGEKLSLKTIWGSGARDVWTGATSQKILHWNGTTWSSHVSTWAAPLTARDGIPALNALWGSASTDVWAATTRGLLHWNGTDWKQDWMMGRADIGSVWGTGPADVWIGVAEGQNGTPSVQHWNGREWGWATATQSRVQAIAGTSRNVWHVGMFGLVERWNGAEFAPEDADTPDLFRTAKAFETATGETSWFGGDHGMVYQDRPCSATSTGDSGCRVVSERPADIAARAHSYRELSTGASHSCAIRRSDSRVFCWGYNDSGQVDAPAGAFIQLAVGRAHSCGLLEDKRLVCWGNNARGQAPTGPSLATYEQVTAAENTTCAIRTGDRNVECWGTLAESLARTTSGGYSELGINDIAACGIRASDQKLECWGDEPMEPTAATFSHVSVGSFVTCAIESVTQKPQCWYTNDEVDTPDTEMVTISAGSDHACGVRASDGRALCWGYYDQGQTPRGASFVPFDRVSSGGDHT